jgi:hypothetical protein
MAVPGIDRLGNDDHVAFCELGANGVECGVEFAKWHHAWAMSD